MEIKYRRFHLKTHIPVKHGKNQTPVPSSTGPKDIIHNGSPVKTGDDSPVAGYFVLILWLSYLPLRITHGEAEEQEGRCEK